MDTSALSFISPRALAARLIQPDAPCLLDVRREPAFESSAHMLAGALRCAPDKLAVWAESQTPREEVVCCVDGHQVSAQATAWLTQAGWQAHELAGGFMGGEEGVDTPLDMSEWCESALPRMPKPTSPGEADDANHATGPAGLQA